MIALLVVSFLMFTSTFAFTNETIESIQSLVQEKINETAAPDFGPCDQNLLRKAKLGDLIEIKRHGYFHWATFYGNATVVNFDNPDFDKINFGNVFDNFTGHVQLRNLFELAGNDSCRINNKINESSRKSLKALSNDEILKKMKYELKHNVTKYHLINFNCEHFAAKLRFGVPFSSQIEAVIKIVKNVKNKLGEIVARMFGGAKNATAKHSKQSIADKAN